MIAQDEQLTRWHTTGELRHGPGTDLRGNDLRVSPGERSGRLPVIDVRLVKLHAVDVHGVVVDLHQVAPDSDHSLDEGDVLPVLGVAGGRLEDDDVAALVVAEHRRQLVDQDHLIWLESVLHRDLQDLVRLGNEMLDQEEDDDRQQDRLDHLEEASAPALVHPEEHPSAGRGRCRDRFGPRDRVRRPVATGLEGSTSGGFGTALRHHEPRCCRA